MTKLTQISKIAGALLLWFTLINSVACDTNQENNIDNTPSDGDDDDNDNDNDNNNDNDNDNNNNNDNDNDNDNNNDNDNDNDNDTDEPYDCSNCTAEICLGKITGKILFHEDESPYKNGGILVCPTPDFCKDTETNENGEFSLVLFGDGCGEFDFEAGDSSIHYSTLLSTSTRFSIGYKPTKEQIDENFVFNIGTQYTAKTPTESTPYTPEEGATVDQAGVSISFPPESFFGSQDKKIKVYQADLSKWTPEFVPNDLTLDALFYIEPYAENIKEDIDISLSIDAATANWENGDTGIFYMLGEWNTVLMECNESDVEVGEFVSCGIAETVDGKIVTSALPRIGWVGLTKN